MNTYPDYRVMPEPGTRGNLPAEVTHDNDLVIQGLVKAYGGIAALRKVDLQFSAGAVHAVIGENGAGKSTLVKVLSGVVSPDRGSVQLGGQPVRLGSCRAAMSAGIATAFQELSLIDGLTVGENLLFGREPIRRSRTINRKELRRRCREVLEEWEASDLPVDRDASQLTLAQQQRLEIVKAMSTPGARVVLLDEPTSSLGPNDVDWLLDRIRRLKAIGTTVIFVSHRLEEIRRVGDTVTVLRDGSVVDTVPGGSLSEDDLIERMLGRRLEAAISKPSRHERPRTDVMALAARDIVLGERSAPMSFAVEQGEVVGVAALAGQGQNALFETLFGLRDARQSVVDVFGERLRKASPRSAMRLGVGLVPEQRKEQGLFLGLPVRQNATVASLSTLSRLGFVRPRLEKQLVSAQIARLGGDVRRLDSPVEALSGGNQQKVVFAKWLLRQCRVLLLFDPTRGVDVGASAELMDLIRDFTAKGGAVLYYSSEINELVALSDRVLVLYGNEHVATLTGEDITQPAILQSMLGAARPKGGASA